MCVVLGTKEKAQWMTLDTKRNNTMEYLVNVIFWFVRHRGCCDVH